MRASSLFGFRFWRVLLGVALLACLGPFAAAQQSQKPPAKPSKQAEPSVEEMKAASLPHWENAEEDADFFRKREEWFYRPRAYPLGHIPGGARLKALEEMDRMVERQAALGQQINGINANVIGFPGPTTWTLVGPQPTNTPFSVPNVSGRVTALAVDPTNSSVVYLGGAQGGVWKTTDGGAHWTPKTDSQASLATGSIAIAPSSPNTIYVGTGELAEFSGDAYYGAGVLKSTDGGSNWTQLGANVFVGPFSSGFFPGGGARIGSLAVHPTNPNLVLAGVEIFDPGTSSGIYCSNDGGVTWVNKIPGAVGTAVVFANSTTAYAALGFKRGNSQNGVYKSINADQPCASQTWTLMPGTGANVLPSPTSGGRIELGVAPSNPSIVYAAVANAANESHSLFGLFKTVDGGTNWTKLSGTPDFCNAQCFYDVVVRVHPTDPNTLFAGGSATSNGTLIRSTDGGASWQDVSSGANGTILHVDHHALAFSNLATGTLTLYVGNDGGAYSTTDILATPSAINWTSLNATLAITQFYPSHSIHTSDENVGIGGTQDNGTQKFTGNLAWDELAPRSVDGRRIGCDGGYSAIDPNIPSTVYATCENIPNLGFVLLFKSVKNADDGTLIPSGSGISLADRSQFIAPLVIDETMTNRLYFGTFRIWQTTDNAGSWTAISQDLDPTSGGTVTAIAVSRRNPEVVYAGSSTGRIWRTSNASAGAAAFWVEVTGSGQLPPRSITSIKVNRTDNTGNTAYVTFSGFSGFVNCPGTNCDTKGHVFKTANGGTTWTDVSGIGGANPLPNTPVNDIVVDTENNPPFNALYVATDIGVFQSSDDGANWSVLAPGLPRVAVFSLALRRESRILRAATHGRSVWILQLTNLAPPPNGLLLTSISPATAQAGSAAFTMTLDGGAVGIFPSAPFTSNTQVLWNGSTTGVSNVTLVSPRRLTAVISAANIALGGTANVSVSDPAATPTASNTLAFSILNPQPTISLVTPGSVTAGNGGNPLNVVVAGTGFNCTTDPAQNGGTKLRFNGVDHNFNSGFPCSSTSMTVTIASSEISSPGMIPMSIFNPPPGGGRSPSSFTFVVNPSVPSRAARVNDYDGDGKTDVAVWRPLTGQWFILPSSKPGTFTLQQWGASGDIPVPGDYDGDGKTDIAVWRPSAGQWFILPSSKPGSVTIQQWGETTDIPVPGDYDGDGKTDIAVWRPLTGQWFILPSSQPGTFTAQKWGVSADIPLNEPAALRAPQGVIWPGQTVIGILSASAPPGNCNFGTPADRWKLDLSSFSTATALTIDLSSSAFDTWVCLLSTTNALIAEDDDSGGHFNSQITLSLSPGEYFIQVTSFSGAGTGTYTLSVEQATIVPPGSITLGQSVVGNLSSTAPKGQCKFGSSPVDRYSFSLSATTTMTIDLASSAFDTFVCLLNNVNQVIDSDDNQGPGTNSRLVVTLTTGSYLIEVTTQSSGGAGGTYTLSLRPGLPPAKPTTVGQTLSGSLSSTAAEGQCKFGSSPVVRYSFSLPATTTVTIDLASSAFDTFVCLLNNVNQVFDSDDNQGPGTNSRLVVTLPAGSYFIEVTTQSPGFAGGPYTLSLQPGFPPAVRIALGETLAGNLSSTAAEGQCKFGSTPVDRYTFSLSATTTMTIDLASSAFDTFVCLLNNVNQVFDSDDNQGPGTNSRLVVTLPAGSYFIEVTTQSPGFAGGPYTLSLQPGFPPAISISPGQTVTGNLSSTAAEGQCKFGSTPVDRYTFSLSATTTMTIDLASSAFDTFVCLLNNVNQVIASDDNGGGGTNSRLVVTLLAGSYFIEVTTQSPGFAGGPYSLFLH